MNLKQFEQAMNIFGSIDKVKRNLERDEKTLLHLRLSELTEHNNVVWNNQNGTTIIKPTSRNTLDLNKKTLKENILLWNSLIEKHKELSA